MASRNQMDGVTIGDGIGGPLVPQKPALQEPIGTEIVQDLVQAMTFQKLSCTPRMDSPHSATSSSTPIAESPTVRARRARTVTSQSRPNVLPEVARMQEDKQPGQVRPRKHSQGSTTLESRRKRSFSMCESDEDDELASLSSTASYQSASKHQKLRDDDDDDFAPTFVYADSIAWANSLSSTSTTSLDSSSGFLQPPATVPTRLGHSKLGTASVHFASSLTSSSTTATPSTSSRSSPRSSISSPRSTHAPAAPSIFKRAQSDCTVLNLRNNSGAETSPDSLSPTVSHAETSDCRGNQMDISTSESILASSDPTEEMRNAPRQGAAPLSGSGRRSVSASSLPTTYRILQVAPLTPHITFSSSISAFAPVVVKPIPLTSPPARKRRPAPESRSPPPFSVAAPLTPHTIQRADTENYG